MALDGSYAGLCASVADFLNRSDLTAAIPDFVTLAEGQMARYLVSNGPVRQMMGRSNATVTDEFSALPPDFMGMRDIYAAGTNTVFRYAEPDRIAFLKMSRPNVTGNPQLYSIEGEELQFWPFTAGTSLDIQITYWKRPVSLSSLVPSNWILDSHPDIYLYGALTQSAPYLQDDARTTTWATMFIKAMDDLIAADKVARHAPYVSAMPATWGTP